MENQNTNVCKSIRKEVNAYLIVKDAHKKDDATFLQCGVNYDSKYINLPKLRQTPSILNAYA